MTVTDLYDRLKTTRNDAQIAVTADEWNFNLAAGDLLAALKTPPPQLPKANFVPVYISQWSAEADRRKNDCGPTCVSMHLRARGDMTTVNTLRTDDATGLTSATNLQALLKAHGVESSIKKLPATGDLYPMVDPYSILLVNYGPLSAYAQDKKFGGWHWLIYIGPDPDDPTKTIVHDPDFWGDRINEGNLKRYPNEILRSAFRPYSGTLCTSVSVPDLPISLPEFVPHKVTVTAETKLNVRSGPSTSFKVVGSLAHGAVVSVIEEREGWLRLNTSDERWISKVYTKE